MKPEPFKKLMDATGANPSPILDEDEETALLALALQAQSELTTETASDFAQMIGRLRDGSSLFVLPGPDILKQMAMIFDLGRRYEAIVQNDMRADKEEPGL